MKLFQWQNIIAQNILHIFLGTALFNEQLAT